MKNYMPNLIKIIFPILLLITLLFAGACNDENDIRQKIVIKLSHVIQITEGRLVSKTTSNNVAELEKINTIASTNKAFFSTVFSSKENSLNQEGELDHYISLVLINEVGQTQINNIIKELEKLEMVVTAYQAPIGEDAGMSLPEN